MYCKLYDSGICRSCQWLEIPYEQQLQSKLEKLRELLPEIASDAWHPVVSSAEQAFRNKAKMVVSGSAERPLLGIYKQDHAVDLCTCPLYPASFIAVFQQIKAFITRVGLTPYNVLRKRGELKFVLLTESTNGEMMLRFVLRSQHKLAALQAAVPELQAQLPQLNVITANIQPVHMAILEGKEEIYLTAEQTLAVKLNDVPLWLRPQSFFQTNSAIAAELYATAREWVNGLHIKSMWDLFCGIGGFGLHCASTEISLTGIEISAEAIACASRSAQEMGFDKVDFSALDATRFAVGKSVAPDLVLVNPPRRGIGKELCDYFNQLAPEWILYSSCNAVSMRSDMARLGHYRPIRIQLFDMFPHTEHYEVLTLLKRN
ncbi:23S rRNA (uracil(747)-C(5))-methyltransferase RlmC [Enterobacteriaceae bacterium LUAb1]